MDMGEAPAAPSFGEEIGGRGRTYFDQVVIDNLMDAFLELAAEVWTTRDRLAVLEAVLAAKGIEASSLVEAHAPTSEEKAERKRLREAFVAQVFASFLRRPHQETPP
jgi:hypothetical protein